nr:eyes absent homolog 2-like [Oncorhynchus nerka]XP_029511709.1 eyes absent homolog 2-like [Oncorhynchus nerka]
MSAYGQPQYSPGLQPAGPYPPYTHHAQGYGMPSYNIKTEDGLSLSPGQNSLLNYSNYSSTPPSQALYGYSTQVTVFHLGFSREPTPSQAQLPSTPHNRTSQGTPATAKASTHRTTTHTTTARTSALVPSPHPYLISIQNTPLWCPITAQSLKQESTTPPLAPPTPGKEPEAVPARRSSDGKLRGRKRVSDPQPPLDSDIERVFVWDLDETIIIFHSLLTGSFSTRFGKVQNSQHTFM